MSYSALQAPTDLFAVNSALHSRAFLLNGEHRRTESDSHSPMSEPRSPLFRPSLAAEISPHFASLYNSPYAAAAVAAVVAGQGSAGVGSSPAFNPYGRAPSAAAFYPQMVSGDVWRRGSYLPQLDFCWPPGLRSLEAVVGPRTKAPREATSILKSWLNEHKDNPYPTKSEKMTLSLVTHMTLTQVSTWFANARRRIKKENKMTWTPKTRCGERDGSSSSNEEENEKDYFGRQNSPFAMRRAISGGDASVQRSSGDIQEQKGSLRYDGPASASNPFNPGLPRKGPTHPLFAAFSGRQPPYGGLNRASLEDAFRQRMLGKQNDRTVEKRREEFLTPDKGPSFPNNNAETNDTRRSPPELCTSNRTFPVLADHGLSQRMENRTPFVRPDQDGPPGAKTNDENDFNKATKEESPEETNNLVTKCDVDDASEPFPVADETEKSDQTSSYKSDKDSDRPKSRDEQSSLQKNAMPSTYRPLYMEGDLVAKSTSNEKMDGLSCWIRDFQHLVASGQEIKAKQALATALVVAAKAGAYSGMGGVQRPSPYYNPHTRPQHVERRFSSDGSPIEESRLEGSRSPLSYNRSFRFPQLEGARTGIETSDVKTSSLDMGTRRSTSPDSPPANAVWLRSPYEGPIRVPDDAPINLSKPAPANNDWKSGNLACDDGRIEA